MTNTIDYEQYRIHFLLLSYAESDSLERLCTLRFDIMQPTSPICLFAIIMDHIIERSHTQPSHEVTNIKSRIHEICSTLEKLRATTTCTEETTQDEAKNGLAMYWRNRGLGDELSKISKDLVEVETLSQLLVDNDEDVEYWSWRFADMALHLIADIEVLANPGQSVVPDDLIVAHKFLRSFDYNKVNDEAYRDTLLTLTQHPFSLIRKDSALTLRHFPCKQTVEALIQLLEDPHDDIVLEAAYSLGELQPPAQDVVPSLKRCLERNFDSPYSIERIAEFIDKFLGE